MAEPLAVTAPLINPNEPEAMIAELHVADGAQVEAGQDLATLETTKATMELTAERSGYVRGLTARQGDLIRAGEVLLWIAGEEDWQPPVASSAVSGADSGAGSGLRITEPARALAEQAGIDLDDLPTGMFITEEWLQAWLESREDLPPIDPSAIVVYGGGGHGKAVIDLIKAVGDHHITGLIDDGLPIGDEIMGVEVLGGADVLSRLRQRGIGQAANAVGGIGDINSRLRVAQRLRAAGYQQPVLVHPTAFVEPNANLEAGVQVFPQAYVGSEAQLGAGVIVNTAAVVSHDCHLREYVNIAPGALLAGAVDIGERTLVGMGVTINLEVVVGAGSRIGNSAVVKQSVPAGTVVPAGSIWPPLKDAGGST